MSPVTQYVYDGTKWQNEVSTHRGGAAALRSATVRKTGAKYVRYEDVYVSGDNLQQTINRVTGNRVLTFPEGTFIIPPNFAYGYHDGIRLGHPRWGAGCRGLSGSGRGTIFKMLSNNQPAWTSGAVPYYLIDAVPGTPSIQVEFSNFYLQGTDLGIVYQGLRLEMCSQSLIENVYITGITGSDKIPPGETGSISLNRCSYVTINDVECDGRRNGVRVSASLIMPNNSDHITVNRAYLHHTKHGGGGIAWFCTNDSVVNDTRSEYIGSGTGIKSGYCFNHEQSNRLVYNNPTMICDRNTTGGTLHMSLNADSARGGVDNVLTVNNPKWDTTAVGGGKFVVHTWDLGANQKQRRAPDVYASGSTRLPYDFLIPTKYGPWNLH
jgi:hypothetical protein